MKRLMYIVASFAAFAAVFAACNKEQNAPETKPADKHIIKVSIPETLTKVSLTDETASGGGMALAWKEGDALRVIAGETSEVYSIEEGFSGHIASFSGNPVEGTAFDIVYPGSIGSKEAFDAFSYLDQRQTGNGSTAHLGYKAYLGGVNTYEEVALTDEWASAHSGTFIQNGVLKLVVSLPSSASKVLKASLVAESELFVTDNAGLVKSNELSVFLKNVDVTEAGQVLTAYMNISAADMPLASGTSLSAKVIGSDGTEYVKAFTLAKDVVLQGGKLNTIKVTGSGDPEIFLSDYYVSVSGFGAKTGADADNAMDVEQFKAAVKTIPVASNQDQFDSDLNAAKYDGVTFHFADGTYLIPDDTCPDGLKIEYQGYSKQVSFTLKGGPAAILSGGGQYRVFTFGNQTDITIEGMTVANGYREAEGGGILVAAGGSGDATLNLKNVTFKNNKTNSSSSGGAIRCAKGTLNATDCIFEADNYARNGGSIYSNNDAALVNCTGCTFKSHTYNTGGGVNNSKGVQHYTDCVFDGCYTEAGNGGAIHANAAKSVVTVEGCQFINCKARTNDLSDSNVNKGAGIISVQQADFTIDNCVFDGCEATTGALIYLQPGNGSTAATGGLFKCNNTKFINNKFKDRGLIQTNGSGSNKQASIGFFNNCLFYNNTMKTNNWGFVLHGSNPAIACFNNCTIYGNTRQQAGGNGVTLNTDGVIVFTNSTLFDSADLTSIRANNASNGTRVLLANSILINTASSGAGKVIANSNTMKAALAMCNNIMGPVVDLTGLPETTVDSGNVKDATAASFTDGAFDATRSVYTWGGPADTFSKMTAGQFEAAVKDNLDSKFNNFNAYIGSKTLGEFYYEWLESIGALGKDALGNSRGSAWWPGAYQN